MIARTWCDKRDFVAHYDVVFGEIRLPGKDPLIVVE